MRTPLRLPAFRGVSLPGREVPPSEASSREQAASAFAPGLDLLRERRRELGQETITVALADRRRLLTQGTLLGSILVGLVLGVIALVYLRHQLVKAQMGQLTQVEAQAAALRKELEVRKASLQQVNRVNKQLVKALTGVRSSSVLMTELQLRTPAGIQLLAADASGPALVLKGQTFDPHAFERINALQLELQNSPLFDPKAIALSKVERKPPEPSQPVGVRPPVGFELSASFASLAPAQRLQFLRQVGAGGLVRRLELLQREGLLP